MGKHPIAVHIVKSSYIWYLLFIVTSLVSSEEIESET